VEIITVVANSLQARWYAVLISIIKFFKIK